MTLEYVASPVVAVALEGYLFYALLRPKAADLHVETGTRDFGAQSAGTQYFQVPARQLTS